MKGIDEFTLCISKRANSFNEMLICCTPNGELNFNLIVTGNKSSWYNGQLKEKLPLCLPSAPLKGTNLHDDPLSEVSNQPARSSHTQK